MKYAVLFSIFAFPVFAQENCGPVEQVLADLAEKYGETIRFTGNSSGGMFTALIVNEETKTWTAVHIDNAGKACLVDAGEGGEFFAARPAGIDG